MSKIKYAFLWLQVKAIILGAWLYFLLAPALFRWTHRRIWFSKRVYFLVDRRLSAEDIERAIERRKQELGSLQWGVHWIEGSTHD